jgi:hypothetical protein
MRIYLCQGYRLPNGEPSIHSAVIMPLPNSAGPKGLREGDDNYRIRSY